MRFEFAHMGAVSYFNDKGMEMPVNRKRMEDATDDRSPSLTPLIPYSKNFFSMIHYCENPRKRKNEMREKPVEGV